MCVACQANCAVSANARARNSKVHSALGSLRAVRLHDDVPMIIEGTVEPGFEPVREAFAAFVNQQQGTGAARNRMCARLAAEQPSWTPGTSLGESAFYGHLVGELVRRIDGRSVGTYLHDEVTGPAGVDFHLGLRLDEQARTVELTDPTGAPADASISGTALARKATLNPPGLGLGPI